MHDHKEEENEKRKMTQKTAREAVVKQTHANKKTKKPAEKAETKQVTGTKKQRTTSTSTTKAGDKKTEETPKNKQKTETPKAKKATKVTKTPLTRVYFRAPASSEPFKLHWSVAIMYSTSKVQNEILQAKDSMPLRL